MLAASIIYNSFWVPGGALLTEAAEWHGLDPVLVRTLQFLLGARGRDRGDRRRLAGDLLGNGTSLGARVHLRRLAVRDRARPVAIRPAEARDALGA